jgi:DNA repair protein RecN (Recombination protein N)
MRQLKGLCRRYSRTLPELVAYRDEVIQSLADLSGEGQSIEVLAAEVEKAQATLTATCTHLTQLRQGVAQDLETRLVSELKPLAMDRVQFEVELTPMPPTASGADGIRFLFSPNPGEPLQPLAETASGGEMSRFLLALKACFSQIDPVGTLVFDEIDVGVSGRVAQAIAEKLYQLGRQHQVLCVTHQPMVAALADAHFRVGKQVVEAAQGGPAAETERTVVRVLPLSPPERREELAQLAGGESHQQALSFAEALLSQANKIRAQG